MSDETILLTTIFIVNVAYFVWTLSRLAALRDDIADLERLVRRVADDLDVEADED